MFVVIGVAALGVITAAIAFPKFSLHNNGTAAKSNRPFEQVSPADLQAVYEENTVAADSRFKGKHLLVRGIVTSINTGLTNDVYLTLAGTNEFLQTQAHMIESERTAAGALKRGASVSLECVGDGDIIKTPMLKDCVFVAAPEGTIPSLGAIAPQEPEGREAELPEPAPPVRLQDGAPAKLSGTYGSGTFDDCCENGVSKRQRFDALRLDRTIMLHDLDPATATAVNENLIGIVQLGGMTDEQRAKIAKGQRIAVSCSSLDEAVSGHVTLQAYCSNSRVTVLP
ncbi:MAG: hypothetical protein H7255_20570 [Ramlibacter sp.]|nr:hypothetical protein [Ramlibacter sp.]